VDVESRALGEPVPDQRRFIGAVVVDDDVHIEPARHLRLDEIEKFAELRRAVPLMKQAHSSSPAKVGGYRKPRQTP
jgi:hypothetical protein